MMTDDIHDYRTVCSFRVDDWALDWALEAHAELHGCHGGDQQVPAFVPTDWCGFRPRSYVVEAPREPFGRAWGR